MNETQGFNPNPDDERHDGNVRKIDVSSFRSQLPPSETKPSTFVPPEDLMVDRTTPKDNEEPNPKFFPQTFDKAEIQESIRQQDEERRRAAENAPPAEAKVRGMFQRILDALSGK